MTINEIAKMAGVSNAAVSRFLNGGSLSEEKRERIRAVVEETGYQPDTYAQMLRTKKIRQIGVIVPKIDSHAVSAVTAGISRVLEEQKYLCLLANTDNDEHRELEYLNLFRANRVAGVILLATILTPAHEELFSSVNIPVVLVGQRHDTRPCVYHNDYAAARELCDLLFDSGRTNVAYIGVTERDIAVGQQRRQAFVDAAAAHGLDAEALPYLIGDFSVNSGYDNAQKLLKSVPNLDGIVCATDNAAVGAMQALKEAHRRIPEEVAVTAVGDNRLCRVIEPGLTTAHYFYEESGARAAQMLLDLVEPEHAEKAAPQQVMLGYELRRRGSV